MFTFDQNAYVCVCQLFSCQINRRSFIILRCQRKYNVGYYCNGHYHCRSDIYCPMLYCTRKIQETTRILHQCLSPSKSIQILLTLFATHLEIEKKGSNLSFNRIEQNQICLLYFYFPFFYSAIFRNVYRK